MDPALAIGLTICSGNGECYFKLEFFKFRKLNMLTLDPFWGTLTPSSRDWSYGG
jgi:hypothetical protein